MFYLQSNDFFDIFWFKFRFWNRPGFSTITPLYPPNLARKDKEWMKVGSKWKCRIGTCIVAYCAKWLLTKHLKKVHGLVAKKAKHGRPSTFVGGPQHQDHAKMHAQILGNAMAVQRQNDQKVINCIHAKTQ